MPACAWLLLTAMLASQAPGAEDRAVSPDPEFYFVRGIYTSPVDGDAWGPRWAIDYPEADRHFLVALRRLSTVDAHPDENAIPLWSERLRQFPFVYIAEAGAMRLSPAEREALRGYLLGGGFLMVDDFWGTWSWEALEAELAMVLPDHTLQEVPMDHPVFHAFYDIDELIQVPNVAQAGTGRTHEYDGYVAQARGIFDADGRLMVLVNWNTDLGDAWEWADDAQYPLHFSNYAYKLGVNIVIYAMSF